MIIVGGGIAGAGLGFALAGRARVLLLEREGQCGYHATGRSAASFTETYGTPVIRRLAMGSRDFLSAPPAGFASGPVLAPRGTVTIARHDQLEALDAMLVQARDLVPSVHRIDPAVLSATVPILRPGYVAGAVIEPDAMDVDVHALHAGYLAGLRRGGGRVVTDAAVREVARRAGQWRVRTDSECFAADVLVDAAGAWADDVAAMAGVPAAGL